MEAFVQRAGVSALIQIVIMIWNDVFLLIMAVSMLLGMRSDHSEKREDRVKVPLTTEIVIFYAAALMYNLFSIFNLPWDGNTSAVAVVGLKFSIFGYFAAGAFQTLFFLQLLKNQVSEKIGNKPLKNAILDVQLLHVFLSDPADHHAVYQCAVLV